MLNNESSGQDEQLFPLRQNGKPTGRAKKLVSDFWFFTLIGMRRVDLILKMLKKIFVAHVKKILSSFEVSTDPLFRNVKFEKVYPPLQIHNF